MNGLNIDTNIIDVISIEGNIGAGKSTFIEIIRNKFYKNKKAVIVPEPVELWKNIKDESGDNILNKFYADIPRWSYSFQNMAYITRIMKLEESIKQHSTEKVIFQDRSIECDKNVFEKMLYDDKLIVEIEHQLYKLWNTFYENYVRKNIRNKTIYLRCSSKTALERIIKRGREEEKNISIEYLEKLKRYHDEWLINKNDKEDKDVLIIDCDKDFEDDAEYQEEIIKQVKEFIYN
jgi:deoxyadenosine/deoxycytidine kinase